MDQRLRTLKRDSSHEPFSLSRHRFWARPLSVLVLLSILAVLVYSNTFSVPFLFDDFRNIINNPLIKEPHKLFDFSNPRYAGLFTFALNYYLGGLDVFGYHLVNLSIHIANSFLVYALVLLLFRASGTGTPIQARIPWIALVTAMLFILHPIQTQAVTYIAQRLASLSTMFYLLTVVAYFKWRLASSEGRRPFLWYGVALLSTILAMKTKENGFTLPFMILLVEAVFFQSFTKKRWMNLTPFLLTLPIVPMFWALSEGNQALTKMATTMSRSDYLFTQFRVIITYLRLLVFPIRQNLDYDYPIYHSLFQPPVFFSFLFLVCFFTFAIYLLYCSRRITTHSLLPTPYFLLIAFGILWFFLTLSVESSIIPIDDVINEHRLYLPSAGLLLAFTTVVIAGHGALQTKRPVGGILSFAASPATLIGFMALILFLLGASTYQRNRVWINDLTLWQDVVNKSPGKARGHNNLGLAYWKLKRNEEALKAYQVSLSLNPYYVEAHSNLGLAYHTLGRHGEAIHEYQAAIALDPDFAPAYTNLGVTYHILRRYDDAIQEYEKTLRIDPQYAEAHYNLAITYDVLKRQDEAIRSYKTAITYNPEFSSAHHNLGNIYHAQGRFDEAIREYQTAITLNPEFTPSYTNLGNVYHDLKRYDEAIQAYEKALTVDTQYVKTQYNLGVTYEALGQQNEAIHAYQTAILQDPDFAPAHHNLGNIYQVRGHLDEAIREYESAVKLDPLYVKAHNKLGVAYDAQGRYEEAIREYQIALSLDPNFTPARINLGATYDTLGRLDEAIREYQTAITLKPNYAPAHTNLGLIYIKQGRITEAKAELEKALKITPDDQTARRLLRSISR
jgi:protein O-mannosyl-transferase